MDWNTIRKRTDSKDAAASTEPVRPVLAPVLASSAGEPASFGPGLSGAQCGNIYGLTIIFEAGSFRSRRFWSHLMPLGVRWLDDRC